MQTATKVLISLGVFLAVFASLVLWTEWGQRSFRPDADYTGCFWLSVAACCLVLGGGLHKFLGTAKMSSGGLEPEARNDVEEHAEDMGTPLCPHCLAPTEMVQASCDICGTPLTSQAGIDPVQQFRTMGATLGQAAASPKGKIVLIGMWVFFIVPIVNCIIVLTLMLNRTPKFSAGREGTIVHAPETWTPADLLQVTLVVGFLLLYTAILIKTTRSYFRKVKAVEQATPDAEDIVKDI